MNTVTYHGLKERVRQHLDSQHEGNGHENPCPYSQYNLSYYQCVRGIIVFDEMPVYFSDMNQRIRLISSMILVQVLLDYLLPFISYSYLRNHYRQSCNDLLITTYSICFFFMALFSSLLVPIQFSEAKIFNDDNENQGVNFLVNRI